MAAERPVIVVGYARSGTTLLQLMLHAHPRVAVPPETRFVLEAYRHRRAFGDLRDPANRRDLAHWIVGRRRTRFADLGLDPAETVERIVAGPGTLGSALATVLSGYAARFGRPRWGDKRPAYLQNLDVIDRLFPDAQFVNLVRDGRDCVASLGEVSWHRVGLPATVAGWARAVDDARRAARRFGPDRWYQLRYEDLVADPPGELAALCRYLGEEYHPAMASPHVVADVAVPARKTWHRRTRDAVTTGRAGSWRDRLTADEIGLCERALGGRLRALGYELSGTGRSGTADLLRYGRVAARHRLAPAKRRLAGAARRLRPEPVVARVLTPPAAGTRPGGPPDAPLGGRPAPAAGAGRG